MGVGACVGPSWGTPEGPALGISGFIGDCEKTEGEEKAAQHT